MDTESTKTLPTWTPYLVGGLFVLLFASLCVWQISRGLEKKALERLFTSGSSYVSWSEGTDVMPFQRLKVTGRYDGQHQFLLENIVLNARQGYYVVTPLVLDENEPVLLVNRGWIPDAGNAASRVPIEIEDRRAVVRGRAGHLPRAGFKMGEGITGGQGWPKLAVFPSYDEASAALGREVHSLVLLLDPEDDYGFEREWQPPRFGAGRHWGYAFQWFVMGLVLAGLLVRNYRRKGFER